MRQAKSCGSLLSLAVVATLAAGCAPTLRVHGYVPSDAEIASVRPGVDTFETVGEVLGSPSSSGLLRDNSWYYVESRVEHRTYNRPKVVDRTVLVVDFSDNGVVTDIVRYGLEDGRIVNLTARTTETGGRELGVLEQLFGNLLNLDSEQFNN